MYSLVVVLNIYTGKRNRRKTGLRRGLADTPGKPVITGNSGSAQGKALE
jgi:hypothetical protein|tara:strand:- start:10420 stop:10566 length:147 start_codon:yes stop_codon:yes gene_type:complete